MRCLDGGQFVLRALFGQHFVDTEQRADGLGYILAVAGDHDDAGDPRLAQQPKRPRRLLANLVDEQQSTRRGAVNGYEYAGGTLVTHALKKSLAPISRGCGCGYKCVAAERNSPAVYDARHSGARLLLDIRGHRRR